jgi:hypothetical protein
MLSYIFSYGVYWRPVPGVGGCTTFNMLSISTQQMSSFCGQRQDSDAHLGRKAVVRVITCFHHNTDPSLSIVCAGNTAVHDDVCCISRDSIWNRKLSPCCILWHGALVSLSVWICKHLLKLSFSSGSLCVMTYCLTRINIFYSTNVCENSYKSLVANILSRSLWLRD